MNGPSFLTNYTSLTEERYAIAQSVLNRRRFIKLGTAALSTAVCEPYAISSIISSDSSTRYSATKQRVANRGIPPDRFLDELVAWGKTAPSEVFAPNQVQDVYSNIVGMLGPWKDAEHRRAAMLEVMRVLAGMESSWQWTAGRDTTNPASVTPDTNEAGAWQVSADSIRFGQDLKTLVLQKVGSLNGDEFQRVTKQNHPFAMEYIARLLRHTVNHNGPVKHHLIDAWLQPAAVTEFMQLMVAS